MEEVIIEKKKILIKLKQPVNIITVLMIIDFYIQDSTTIILKIILITKKNHVNWYNDITNYKNLNLIFLYMRLRDELFQKENKNDTHITLGDLNLDAQIEIQTLNDVNVKPKLVDREFFLKKLYEHWLNSL